MSEDVLAWDEALGRVAGDRELLEDLVGCFLVDLETHLEDLRRATDEGGEDRVRAVARAVEAAARRVGARAVARAAEALCAAPGSETASALESEAHRLRAAVVRDA